MDGTTPQVKVVIEEPKKQNIFKRIKRWWKEDLDQETRDWLKIVGIWTVDGAMFGTLITTAVKDKTTKKKVDVALGLGYMQGKMDAYKEIAQNPYNAVDKAIRIGEKNGTVKRIKF